LNLAIAYAQSNQHDQAMAAAQNAEDIARSSGQQVQAEQIQSWLNTFQASKTDAGNAQPAAFESAEVHKNVR